MMSRTRKNEGMAETMVWPIITHPTARLRHVLAGAVMFAGLLGAAYESPAATRSDYPRLFGTREVLSTNVKRFPKWTGMLKRFCLGTTLARCPVREWNELLERLRGAEPMAQLDSVHRHMNETPYITDQLNYNLSDYWATPRQFVRRDGDCEDYAIAKYMLLRALGWDGDDMRIAVVRDLNLRIAHAILIVYSDGVAWVLDNQIKRVVAANRIRHYSPYYSINETAWWRHKP